MAKKSTDQKENSPRGEKGMVITVDQAIKVIKTKRFTGDEVRFCFWEFAANLGKKSLDHPDFKKALRVMRKIRPKSHEIILKNITEAVLKSKKR